MKKNKDKEINFDEIGTILLSMVYFPNILNMVIDIDKKMKNIPLAVQKRTLTILLNIIDKRIKKQSSTNN